MQHNWCLFRDKLKEVEELCVPKLSISERVNDPWFTREVKRSLNKKKGAYQKATKTSDPDDWLKYSACADAIRKAKNYFYNCTLQNLLKTDPKKILNVINPKNKNSAPPLTSEDGKTLPVAECAEKLDTYFSQVFTVERPLDSSLDLPSLTIPHPFSAIVITTHGVACAIDRLALKTSPGPDGISAKLLKLTSPFSSYFLSLIFQQSIDSVFIPEDWKSAHVTPIFKSGDNTIPNNYRPISLTSICCKLLEHILFTHIMNHLNLNKLLLNNQHGFRKDLSCQTQLFELVTHLHSALNLSRPVDSIFIDFSKAFDRVPHKRLLLKIRHLQLDQNTTRWIEEFLTNRFQTVKLNNDISNQTRVSSGVPLLFMIYINDIACSLKSAIRLFADDRVVYREIYNPADTIILQSDLIKLEEWCSRWQMEINVEKTKHIMFSPTPEAVLANYKINDTPIDLVQSFKYLGVFFTANLKWTCHIEYITTKALK